jgi:DUF971 family protein
MSTRAGPCWWRRAPEDVRPVRVSPVGRYAIQITWTDGHDSGIYSFEYLRDLGASEA